jgi:cell division protein FtsL
LSQQHQRRHLYRAIAAETTVKLAVNAVLSVVAVSAVITLLPYQQSRQQDLQDIRAEVNHVETRVNRLQGELQRLMAPEQATSIMEEHSYRVDPNKVQIVIDQ